MVLFLWGLLKLQAQETIYIQYFSRFPFSVADSVSPSGIEIEIINEYLLWLKSVKKKDFSVVYKRFAGKEDLLTQSREKSVNSINLGSFITNADKTGDVEYSVPYLKNLSFCITNGNAPDIKNKTSSEIQKALGVMTAATVAGSNLNNCVNDLKKIYLKDLKITFEPDQTAVLNSIAKNVLVFGYVDAVEFWHYLKNNPTKFLKVQKCLEESKETFSFVFPKGSEHKAFFAEFFNSFKMGVKYRAILEKHMGGFMAQNLAVK